MGRLAGQISWIRFLQHQAATFLVSGGSLMTVLASIIPNFPFKLLLGGISILVSLAGVLTLLIHLSGLVTWFEVEDSTLRYSTPLRRGRTVSLDAVVDIPASDLSQRGVRVRLRDGSSFYLDFRALENGLQLANRCLDSTERSSSEIEGGIDAGLAASTLVWQMIICVFLAALALLGLVMLAMGIGRPGVQMRTPGVFIALALVTWGLSLTGFYVFVLRCWLSAVRWYRLEQGIFSFRTIFSGATYQQYLSDLESVKTERPASGSSVIGIRVAVRFRDGQQVTLPLSLLPDASRLLSALKVRLEQRDTANLPPATPPLTSEHPAWSQIEPYLIADEMVYYLGRPNQRKQWHETAGEIGMGVLILLMTGPAVALLIWTGIANRAPGALFGVIPFGLFNLIGVYCLAAPYRKRRMQEKTLYAVTNLRAIVLHGCLWGPRAAPLLSEEVERTFAIDEVRNYEVETAGRDIVFGGRWMRGRKKSQYWVHQGFLAPDDPAAALAAIRRLLAEHPRDAPQAA
ncbi:hypothetical protein [Blastopirellula marina]|uniref:PH domain-containing protein n=1 Tax=Blastopirellula marina TaxID=124 RepID=A0A2S8GGI6_9BACT|nr:hypothetical protein [Blastopirellula marina]PQO43577.1 hypothetical protein C5Y93_23290 [Blastopirellula marina]